VKSSRGFSLIEMVITIFILAVISLGTLVFTKPLINLWGNQNFYQGPAMEGRLALERMVREMDSLKTIKDVLTATASSYSFVDMNNNTITYTYSSGVLTRRVGSSSQPNRTFISSLSAFSFTYRDKDNTVLTTPTVGSGTTTNIRTIAIQFTVTVGSRSSQISAVAHPRNVLE